MPSTRPIRAIRTAPSPTTSGGYLTQPVDESPEYSEVSGPGTTTQTFDLPKSGTYSIELTVVDDKGASTTTYRRVVVENRKPVAVGSVSATSVALGVDPFSLTGSTSYDPDGTIDTTLSRWVISGKAAIRLAGADRAVWARPQRTGTRRPMGPGGDEPGSLIVVDNDGVTGVYVSLARPGCADSTHHDLRPRATRPCPPTTDTAHDGAADLMRHRRLRLVGPAPRPLQSPASRDRWARDAHHHERMFSADSIRRNGIAERRRSAPSEHRPRAACVPHSGWFRPLPDPGPHPPHVARVRGALFGLLGSDDQGHRGQREGGDERLAPPTPP
ncbi:MAG: hypothetical protein V9F03_01855 [Microthrixaceae bacterium]